MFAMLHPRLILPVGLSLAVGLDTLVQLVWKVAAGALDGAGDGAALVTAAWHEPLFLVVAAVMAVQYGNWLLVLRRADLSFAHAVTALSYATVAFASALWLGEQVDWTRGAGIALILAGVWLVGRTPALTHDRRAS